jgi:phospho-N-acetylmuramoyl-pentapeptide-transferase
MILKILPWLTDIHHSFIVLHYLTFRAFCTLISSFSLTFIFMPAYIKFLKKIQAGQRILELIPKAHQKKQGTPTMGGLIMISICLITCIMWGNWENAYLQLSIGVMLGFATVGLTDDLKKIKRKQNKGLSALNKFALQSLLACLFAYFYWHTASLNNIEKTLFLPIFKNATFSLNGFTFTLLAWFIIVGSSNAVNLTDGLDGLAITPIIIVAASLAALAYLTGHSIFAHYLHLPFLAPAGELIILAASIIGTGLAFLWFNTHPAQIFMGDVGSLSFGATLATIAILIKQEVLFAIMSGVFILETMSVILQVASFKLRKKRIFKMAPIHHHYELKGWSEPQVIVRFWIIAVICSIIALATLKIR